MEDLSQKLNKHGNRATLALVIFLVVLSIGLAYSTIKTENELELTKAKLDSAKSFAEEKIAMIEAKVSTLQKAVSTANGLSAQVAESLSEIERSQSAKSKTQEELVTEAVSKNADSVVSIVATRDFPNFETRKLSAGTGFFVTTDGYIVTNRHVVKDQTASYTVILPNGISRPATVIYWDADLDIAILKTVGLTFMPATLGDSSDIKLGQTVIAIGYALGKYSNSVSIGNVSGLNRTISAGGFGSTEKLSGLIQIDAAINAGNSGGPLIDLTGKVIGVNVATVTEGNSISFSIPINTLKYSIESVIGRKL